MNATDTNQPQIIAVHSFVAGTGRSSLIANLAALLAAKHRVAVIDLDLLTPSLHILLGLQEDDTRYWVNDYLSGVCDIEHTAHEIKRDTSANSMSAYSTSANSMPARSGALFLVPASDYIREIKSSLRLQYDPERLHTGFQRLIEALSLDFLLINVQAGLNGVTLPTIATAEALATVMRLDRQDYQGTAVTLDVASQLDIDHLLVIANMVPAIYDRADVERELLETFEQPSCVIPHSAEFAAAAQQGLFVERYPHHPHTATLEKVATALTHWRPAPT